MLADREFKESGVRVVAVMREILTLPLTRASIELDREVAVILALCLTLQSTLFMNESVDINSKKLRH